jgi:hypothetical protein
VAESYVKQCSGRNRAVRGLAWRRPLRGGSWLMAIH